MDKTLEEFEKEFLEDIRIGAQIEGTTPDDYFLNDMLGRLSSMGDIIDAQVAPMQKRCRNGRIMSFDAYAFDESDKSVVLVANDFIDDLDCVLTMSDINQHKQRMLNFLSEAYDDKLDQYFDISDALLFVGRDIGERMKIDYVSANDDKSIDRIKLIIVTNKKLSGRVKTIPSDDFAGKKVELDVWSLARLYELYESGRAKEAIVIETSKYGIDGIPCIKAQMSGNLDYDAYLAIIPGELLHEIYYEHGSRILEGNVRAFLSNRGKINKGIRNTIKNEPTKFFTYNNGIACTASSVALSSDGHKIVSIEDLQIINGGQTTASLTSAKIKDRLSLDSIFVPMKLTVVRNDDYESVIQNISKYANSQNRIKESDLFSNHPFHRKFEELAKKIQAPAHGGLLYGTYWFYERSRGKYDQEQFKMLSKSKRAEYAAKYPKSQIIKKEDLSKYYTCAKLLRPDIVSKGPEKCMSFFAEVIDEEYQKRAENFNDQFYKNCICYAILFRETNRMVKKSPWYRSETYTRPGVVAYAISKLVYSIPDGYCLDFNLIWKKQELYPSLNEELEKVARKAFEFVERLGGNGMEHFKKESVWNAFKEEPYDLSRRFCEDLLSSSVMESQSKAEAKDVKLTNKLNIEMEIVQKGEQYWENLIKEGLNRHLLSDAEVDLLRMAARILVTGKMPSQKQLQWIWKIREKLDNAGVLV